MNVEYWNEFFDELEVTSLRVRSGRGRDRMSPEDIRVEAGTDLSTHEIACILRYFSMGRGYMPGEYEDATFRRRDVQVAFDLFGDGVSAYSDPQKGVIEIYHDCFDGGKAVVPYPPTEKPPVAVDTEVCPELAYVLLGDIHRKSMPYLPKKYVRRVLAYYGHGRTAFRYSSHELGSYDSYLEKGIEEVFGVFLRDACIIVGARERVAYVGHECFPGRESVGVPMDVAVRYLGLTEEDFEPAKGGPH